MNCQERKRRGEEKEKEKAVEKEAGRTNFKKGSLRLAMDGYNNPGVGTTTTTTTSSCSYQWYQPEKGT
jgi:hypothetical protein